MSNLNQIEMVSLDQLVDKNHPYRQLLAIVDFEKLCEPLRDLDNVGRSGVNSYSIVTLFQCLLLPFLEDISDRELERYLRKNNMTDKNRDKDRWIRSIRSPFERVFSKSRKRVHYRSRAKNQFDAFLAAIIFNFKRLLMLRCQPPWP